MATPTPLVDIVQFAGFRLVSSETEPDATCLPEIDNVVPDAPETEGEGENNVYETKTLVDMYMDLHFPAVTVDSKEVCLMTS